MFFQLHGAVPHNGVVMIRNGNRYSIEIFAFLIKHFAPVVVKFGFGEFFHPRRCRTFVHIAQKKLFQHSFLAHSQNGECHSPPRRRYLQPLCTAYRWAPYIRDPIQSGAQYKSLLWQLQLFLGNRCGKWRFFRCCFGCRPWLPGVILGVKALLQLL